MTVGILHGHFLEFVVLGLFLPESVRVVMRIVWNLLYEFVEFRVFLREVVIAVVGIAVAWQSLLVVAAFAVCIFARMRLPVCKHPAVTFGSSAHGSLLRAKFNKKPLDIGRFLC